jgi:hypothetical protein
MTELELVDHTKVAVGENASVKLDRFVYDPDTLTISGMLNFGEGAFRYIGGDSKHKEALRLNTPVATIAIRGTELVIFVAPSGRTEINVIEGAISVSGCGGGDSADLGAGERATIEPDCSVSVDAARKLPPHYIPRMPSDFASTDDGARDGEASNAEHGKEKMGAPERRSAPETGGGSVSGGKGKGSAGGAKAPKGSGTGGASGSTGGQSTGTGGGSTGGTGGQTGGGANAGSGGGSGTGSGGSTGGGSGAGGVIG